ncbi:alpha/beta fold hydrolase [Phenylobacterium sp. VNQ135]|uniref:alpha/beta fold hydrolase n=1 Tax=Phenylobacterium sp. VNQ135 TaxID=3400922 RepID=UPI003BFAF598
MGALDFGDPNRPVDVVFSHANGFNARTYRTILAPLALRHRVLALDLRGHGRSTLATHAEGRSTWTDIAEDLLALTEAIDARNIVLSGHSMGGTASLLATHMASERIRALVLFEPVILSREAAELARKGPVNSPLADGARRRRATFASRQEALEAYRGRGAFKSLNEAQLEDYVADAFRDRPAGGVELACSPEWEVSNFVSHGHDAWSALLAPGPPVRILRAEHGSTCASLAAADTELSAAGRISMDQVNGATHLLPMEHPELVRFELERAVETR